MGFLLNMAEFDIQPFVQPFDYAGQQREGEQYLAGYGQAISGLPSPTGRLQEFQAGLGVPQLQQRVLQLGELGQALGSQILGQPGQVAGTTRESLVTEAQRQGLVQAQQRPLYEQLGTVTRGLATAQPALQAAQQQAGLLTGLQISRDEMGLLPFERGFSLLEQRQAREFSGWTTQMSLELDRLVHNQSAGVTLSEGEKNRMNELAVAEKGYEAALNLEREKGTQKIRVGETLEGKWTWG